MGVVQSAECERARALASLGLDGELSQVGQAMLRAHVGRCAACATFAHELEAMTQELRTAPLARPAVVHAPSRRRSAMRTLRLLVAAAAVVLAAGLGSLAGSLRHPGVAAHADSPGSRERAAALHSHPGSRRVAL
jgi:predicted anti-sigma-YlaC factor YlaD